MLKYIDDEQFINDFRQYLDINGISSAHVARKMGISPQQLNNIYNKKELTVNDVKRMCAAIDLECDVLICRHREY